MNNKWSSRCMNKAGRYLALTTRVLLCWNRPDYHVWINNHETRSSSSQTISVFHCERTSSWSERRARARNIWRRLFVTQEPFKLQHPSSCFCVCGPQFRPRPRWTWPTSWRTPAGTRWVTTCCCPGPTRCPRTCSTAGSRCCTSCSTDESTSPTTGR